MNAQIQNPTAGTVTEIIFYKTLGEAIADYIDETYTPLMPTQTCIATQFDWDQLVVNFSFGRRENGTYNVTVE